MKKVLLAVLMISVFASCKKSKSNSCEVSVAAMSGTYKLTKYTFKVTNLPAQDYTNLLTDCDKSGIYQLNADKTATYSNDASCFDNETGTWDVVDGKITISVGYYIDDLKVAGWDCNGFDAEESNSTSGITSTSSYHFTKQ